MMWDLDSARAFVRDLQQALTPTGYCVGLTGSTLFEGASDNDLDVIIFPRSTVYLRQDPEILYGALRLFGLRRVADKARVPQAWRKKGSTDTKHVEVWLWGARRVDLFFLR